MDVIARRPEADAAISRRLGALPARRPLAAEQVVIESTLVRISPEGVDAFMAAVAAPAARLIGGRAFVVTALDADATAFWARCGFLPAKDDTGRHQYG